MTRHTPTSHTIIAATCHAFRMSKTDMLSPSTEKRLHHARSAAAHIMRGTGAMTMQQIAHALNRDAPATVRNMLKTARKLLETDPTFQLAVRYIKLDAEALASYADPDVVVAAVMDATMPHGWEASDGPT